jgi:hypothetical protein
MLLSAIAYNLKKLLKYQSKQLASVAIALCPAQQGSYSPLFSAWFTNLNPIKISLLSERLPSWSSATATVVCNM